MILEALECLLTPVPAALRGYGYGVEMAGLGARWRRRRAAWAPHVAAARAFVEDAARRAPEGGHAVVIGSGRLIEIPLEALARRFATVTLADLVHPLPVRLAALRHRNVRLLTTDITGVLASLGQAGPLPVPPEAGADIGRFDFAVSCNVLSQLPILPLERLERRVPAVPEDNRLAFARTLLAAHLACLRRTGRVAALFSDVDSLWRDRRTGEETRETDRWALPPDALPPPDAAWTWAIAPAPELDRHRDLTHTVHAWSDLNGG
jgi:hypothetical protein